MKRLVVLGVLLTRMAFAQAAGNATEPRPYEPKTTPIELPPRIEFPATAPLSTVPLTADEAARIALRTHANVTIAQENVRAAQGRTQQIQAGLNPRLSLNANYTDVIIAGNPLAFIGGAGGGFGGGGAGFGNFFNADSATAGATVNQLVYDFGHTRELVRQAEEQAAAQEANVTRVQQDLVQQVKQAFYQLAQAERLVNVQEANLRTRQEQFRQAEARWRSGLGLPSDVTRAQTAVSEAVSNVQAARGDADLARVNLNLGMGVDPRTPLSLAETGEPVPDLSDPVRLVESALQRRPEMAQALAQIRANLHGLNAAHSTSDPVITVGLNYSARFIPGIPQINSLNLVLGVNYNLFDGGLEEGRVREAEATLNISKAQLQNIGEGVKGDVVAAYTRLHTAEQRLLSAEAAEANAAETVRLATGRYQVGLGILLDVLDAQNALTTAQVNRVNAQTQISLARAALARAIGQPLADPPPQMPPLQLPRPSAVPTTPGNTTTPVELTPGNTTTP